MCIPIMTNIKGIVSKHFNTAVIHDIIGKISFINLHPCQFHQGNYTIRSHA